MRVHRALACLTATDCIFRNLRPIFELSAAQQSTVCSGAAWQSTELPMSSERVLRAREIMTRSDMWIDEMYR